MYDGTSGNHASITQDHSKKKKTEGKNATEHVPTRGDRKKNKKHKKRLSVGYVSY